MPTYSYKVRDRSGKLVSGVLEGKDERDVINNLERLGLTVVNITSRSKKEPFAISNLSERFQHVEKQEIIIFTRQLATLLRTGMALSPSLTTICEQTVNKRFRPMLEGVKDSVQGGSSFSEALSKYPSIFSELFVSMVEVGETGGILDKVLDRLAVLGTQEMEMQSRIKSALVYPVILVLIAFGVVSFLVVGVLPKFVMVFKSTQTALPLPTQLVLGVSWIIRKFWPVMILGAALIGLWFKGYISKPEGRFKFHSWLLKIPMFGKIYAKVQIARFARTLSTLLSVGIPILQGLTVVEKIISNSVFKKAIQNVRMSITEGRPLIEPFRTSGLFSPMVIQMISTGEKTGKLSQMLDEVAAFYEPEIEYTVKNLTSLLEPLMLLTMGIMVGFIALSVLLPIFNLIRVFRS